MTRFSAILPMVLAPLVLAGCFPNPDYRDLPNSSVISSTRTVVAVVAVADAAQPSPAELAAVADALARAGDSGVRVRVRLPQGAPVPPAEVMRARIAGLGVDPAIAVVEPSASASGTSLAVVRIALTAPDCAAMVTPSEEWSAWSRPRMSFGCATYTNLGNMLADPADLAAPRGFGGPDATVSAKAVTRYQADKVKPLRDNSATYGLNVSNSSNASSSSQSQ